MSDVYDIMAELLVDGHGDKTDFLCGLYDKYRGKGLSHDRLRKLFVKNGYLRDVKEDSVMSYDKDKDWHKIAMEYKEEIGVLWNDLLGAMYSMEDMVDYSDHISDSDDDFDDYLENINGGSENIKRIASTLKSSYLSSEKAVHEIERFN